MNNKFPIHISKGRIFSSSQKAFSIQDSKNLGEKSNNKVNYSEFEAFYLFETNQAEIIKNKSLSEEKIIREFSKKHKEFLVKYQVFKALRKNHIVKTGSKFGAEFRVYDQIANHAKWLVFPVKQSEKLNLHELISKTRIAHSTAKKLLLAIVDSENDVLFYEIDWIKI
ncbi:tRNA-intron lyase [Candidatus Pacearchaeota archaeon]|nr:tRNA-intron lyase [Candidatus Pacearchaeota archaeon]